MRQLSILLLIVLLAFSCQKKDVLPTAPPIPPASKGPVITSITPASASPNTLVTIRGLRFSPIVDSDTVAFNGVKATVKTASDTVITALVPIGGSNGPVTVVTDLGGITGPVFNYGPNIYVSGYERMAPTDYTAGRNAIANYWKNGVSVPLVSKEAYGYGYGIILSDTDVYVIGTAANTGNFHSYYWTKEGYFPLTEGPYDCMAFSMALVNGKVYAAGTYMGPKGNQALLWKNGVTDSLPAGIYLSTADCIAVDGTDIYVGGSSATGPPEYPAQEYNVPVYWKNDSLIFLPEPIRYDYATVNGIAVLGSDIYAVGTVGYGTTRIILWKNGVPTAITDGSQNAAANALLIVGNDVYIAGYESNGSFSVAKYWKNGVAVSITNGQTDAAINAITVVGNDVYVAGFESTLTTQRDSFDPDLGYVAKYWKNGVPVTLGTGLTSSQAYGIAVK
jgi:hypothetical protein